jgi:hypothetical protein
MLAYAHDLGLLFLILAIVGFAMSLYLAYVGQWIGALVALIIAVVILVYA